MRRHDVPRELLRLRADDTPATDMRPND